MYPNVMDDINVTTVTDDTREFCPELRPPKHLDRIEASARLPYDRRTSPRHLGEGRMRCKSCGLKNREGARFCNKCGETLLIACRHCGAKIAYGSPFCDSCSEPVLRVIENQERVPTAWPEGLDAEDLPQKRVSGT
jgi:Double zinc ribbon